ncbi:MAG: hypothetical protein KC609_04000 [Myxococcales bacterium]|nr:hypothetical protein [Myxococcales bacterium]
MRHERSFAPTTHDLDLLDSERRRFDVCCVRFGEAARPELRCSFERIAATPPPDDWASITAKGLPNLVDPATAGPLAAALPVMERLLRAAIPPPDDRMVTLLAENLSRCAVPIWIELLRRGLKLARSRRLTSGLLFDETIPHPLAVPFEAFYLGDAQARRIFAAFRRRLIDEGKPTELPGGLQIRADHDGALLERRS